MSKNFKQALGSVGPALHDILSAIIKTNDLARSGKINSFKEMVQIMLLAKKEGIDTAAFMDLMAAYRREAAVFSGGEIEMAGSASTGFETKEGTVLHVDFNAGGSVAGFNLGLDAGFEKQDQKAQFERSSQNFRILARWQVVPEQGSEEIMKLAAEFVSKATPGATIPGLPEEFESPQLAAIKDAMPILKELLAKNE